jgi:methylglutamate dehydrogenase subunit D
MAGVRVTEFADFEAISVTARRGISDAVVEALSQVLGVTVADAAKRAASGMLSIVGTGPGQWQVLARDAAARTKLAELRTRLAGRAALSDQSDAKVVLDVSGPEVRRALAKGIAIDLDPAVFQVGDAALTVVGHINVQLAYASAPDTFELITAASTARSFWHWLESSAAEFGLEVAG